MDRTELFKRGLAYLPSVLLSTMDRLRISPVEQQIFATIANLAAQNLNLDDEKEYVYPEKYLLFRVQESQDPRYFNELEPGLPPRMVSTTAYLHDPIYINTKLVNAPGTEISLPFVFQTLFHELGRKVVDGNPRAMALIDQLSAKVARVLEQDYQVIEINPGQRLHILNAPFRKGPPQLDYRKPDYKSQLNSLMSHRLRRGREVLIFCEDKKGFIFVPTLQPALLKDLLSMAKVKTEDPRVQVMAHINLEEVRVDRVVGKYPLVRFIFNVTERAYIVGEEGNGDEKIPEDKKTKFLESPSANVMNMPADQSDELIAKTIEAAVLFKPDGNIDITRRQVVPREARLQVVDMKSVDQGLFKTGHFTIQVPADRVKDLISPDLRAYLWLRMEGGLVRVEVTRMIPEGSSLKVEFNIPSEASATVPYFVEEVILANKDHEVVIDLPETITVKNPKVAPTPLVLKKLEYLNSEKWDQLEVSADKEDRPNWEFKMDDIGSYPGLTRVDTGKVRLRFHFESTTRLHEIYFYLRSIYYSHDPIKKSTIGQMIDGNPLLKLVATKIKNFDFESLSHVQVMDDVLHIPASQMRQTLEGNNLTVEFDIPMQVLKDKGLYTYDTSLRYFGKIIAVNQRLEKWRVMDLKSPLFSVNGTAYGAKSCNDLFNR